MLAVFLFLMTGLLAAIVIAMVAMMVIPPLGVVAVFFGTLALWGVAGFQTVPPINRALVIILGRRSSKELPEGPTWIIPGIMSLQIISTKKIIIYAGPTTVPTLTQEEVTVNVSMLTRPANGYISTYIEVDNVEESARQWILQQVAQSTASLDMDDVINKDVLRQQIWEDIRGQTDPELEQTTAGNWIIPNLALEILDIQVESIKQSPQAAEAADQKRKELRQREAEETQIQARVEQAQRLVDAARAAGEHLSFQEALQLAAVEGGNLQGIKVIGGGNSLTDAAALIAASKRGGE